MKKLLLMLTCLAATFGNAQTTIFQDNFDSYPDFAKSAIGSWTLVDLDLRPTYGFDVPTTFTNSGTAMAFIVFNSTATTPPLTVDLAASDWSARSGSKAMACFAAVPNGAQPKNNDWLISPQIQLGSAGNTLSFWAKSCDAAFPDEDFKVGVSTTNTAPASFTTISSGAFIRTVFGPYVEYTYNLDAYQSQNVYIGINCVSVDQFGFMLDDFKVTATTLFVNDFISSKFSISPNPVKSMLSVSNAENINVNTISIADLNGRVIKEAKYSNVSNMEVDLSELSSGMYIMNINSDQGIATKKIVKE